MSALPTFTPAGPWAIVKKLQDVNETTYGETPSSPTFVHSGHNAYLSDTTEITAERYYELGNRDMYSLLKTGRLHAFELRQSPFETRLWRWGSEAAVVGSGGTAAVSKTFTYTEKIDNTETWFRYLGCIPERSELEINDAGLKLVQNILCQDMPDEVTSDPFTTPTYASADTTALYTNLSSDKGPFTFNSTRYDVKRMKITVNHKPHIFRPNGWEIAKYIFPTTREINVEFDAAKYNSTIYNDAKSLTARSASYVIASGKTVSFTDMKLQRVNRANDIGVNDLKLEKFVGTASAITTTA